MKIAVIPLILAFLLSTPTLSESAQSNGEIASWYGGGEKLNKHTANGDVFDPHDLTCASWYHPFDTHLKVTNLSNGKSVVVRVNDRGPNKRLGRAIDLSREAFRKIANLNNGLIEVKIEQIG